MEDDLQQKINDKLAEIKEEFSIKMISMQFYAAFLDHYSHLIQEEGENKITNFITRHITLLVKHEIDNPPDAEIENYFLAYMSSFVYDYEIINEKEIADLIMRRYNEYRLLYESEEEAWEKCFIKEYEIPDEFIDSVGPSYRKNSSAIIKDAIEYLKMNVEYFEQYTLLEGEELENVIGELFTLENKQFTSLFKSEIPQVLIKLDSKLKLSIPNLLLACVGLFIEWQEKFIFINN